MSEARIIDEIVTDVNQHTTAAVGGIKMSSNGRKLFATDGVFIVPEGVTEVWVTGCGAGGGGYIQTSTIRWSGGGGQACSKVSVPVAPSENIRVTIGRAGDEQASGGATSFGSKLSLFGGQGTKGTSSTSPTSVASQIEPLGEPVLTEFGVPTGGYGGVINTTECSIYFHSPAFYAFTIPTVLGYGAANYRKMYGPASYYGKGGIGTFHNGRDFKAHNGVLLIEW